MDSNREDSDFWTADLHLSFELRRIHLIGEFNHRSLCCFWGSIPCFAYRDWDFWSTGAPPVDRRTAAGSLRLRWRRGCQSRVWKSVRCTPRSSDRLAFISEIARRLLISVSPDRLQRDKEAAVILSEITQPGTRPGPLSVAKELRV